MPTILRNRGYRFFFFSNEGNEPIHVHVEKGGRYAKFWLNPVKIAMEIGFNKKDLKDIDSIIGEHEKK
jgi:hypothetical protein